MPLLRRYNVMNKYHTIMSKNYRSKYETIKLILIFWYGTPITKLMITFTVTKMVNKYLEKQSLKSTVLLAPVMLPTQPIMNRPSRSATNQVRAVITTISATFKAGFVFFFLFTRFYYTLLFC